MEIQERQEATQNECKLLRDVAQNIAKLNDHVKPQNKEMGIQANNLENNELKYTEQHEEHKRRKITTHIRSEISINTKHRM